MAVGFCPVGHTGRHFVGVQIVESMLFSELPEGVPMATIGGYYDSIIAKNSAQISTHEVTGTFHDVGTPTNYLNTALTIARSEGLDVLPIGSRCDIHPTATLTRTIVWNDVTIAEDCHLTDCIVADGVELPAGSSADQMVIISSSDGPEFIRLDTA